MTKKKITMTVVVLGFYAKFDSCRSGTSSFSYLFSVVVIVGLFDTCFYDVLQKHYLVRLQLDSSSNSIIVVVVVIVVIVAVLLVLLLGLLLWLVLLL